jgi:WD40 repeat protein
MKMGSLLLGGAAGLRIASVGICSALLGGCVVFGGTDPNGAGATKNQISKKGSANLVIGARVENGRVTVVRADGGVYSAAPSSDGNYPVSPLCSHGAVGGPFYAAALSADGRMAALSGRGVVRVTSLLDCRVVAETRSVLSRVGSLSFSPDGQSLLLGAYDGKVYRWRFSEQVQFHRNPVLLFERYVGHGGVVSSVVFHPAGRVFFSGDWTGSLRAWLRYDEDDYRGRWDAVSVPGRFYTEIAVSASAARLPEAIEAVTVSKDAESLLSATRDGKLQVWSVRGFANRGEVKAHEGEVRSIALDSSGTLAASGGRDGFIRLWRISWPKEVKREVTFLRVGEWYLPNTRAVSLARDGSVIAVSDDSIRRFGEEAPGASGEER